MLPTLFAQAQDPAARVQNAAQGVEYGLYTVAGLICLGLVLVLVELLPGFIAAFREHPNALAIFVLCFFLGWTGIGWIVAMVWAFTTPQPAGGTTVIIRERSRRRRDDDYDD